MADNVIALKPRPKAKPETSRALAFTSAALRKLVADPSTPPSLADSKQPGLFLRRAKSGRWAFVFERRIDKRLFRKTLMRWADRCDLDQIRAEASDLLRDARAGQWAADVQVVVPTVNPRAQFTWEAALADHIRVAEIRPKTAQQYAAAVRVFAPSLPPIVADLTGPLWRDALLNAKDKGLTLADGSVRVLSAASASAYARCLSAMWGTWAYGFDETARPALNPIASGMQIGPRRSLWTNYEAREGRLTLAQVGVWLKSLRQRSVELDPTHASALAALEMLTLTGMRSGEVLGLTWSEVRGDWLEIGKARMKAKNAFRRPITRRMAEILEAQRQITGGEGHVFPSWKVVGAHLFNVRKALAPIASAVGAPDLTPHDLRRTFASISKEQRADAGIVKRLLAHSLKDDVTEAHYSAQLDAMLRDEAQRIEDAMTAGAGA